MLAAVHDLVAVVERIVAGPLRAADAACYYPAAVLVAVPAAAYQGGHVLLGASVAAFPCLDCQHCRPFVFAHAPAAVVSCFD